MSALIKHNGVWKEPEVIYVKDGGVWKEVSGKRFVPGEPMYGGFFGGLAAFDGIPHALILADKSAEQSLKWRTIAFSTSGTSSSTDGWANTNAMNNSSHPAAQYCRQYDGGGYTDWYLGAPKELEIICLNLLRTGFFVQTIAPDFASGGPQVLPTYLWSSRQRSLSEAYRVTTSSGGSSSYEKTNSVTVRPIRRVPISL